MFDLKEAAVRDADDWDFFCFFDSGSGVALACPELTEKELQAIEENADNWYLGIAGIL